LQNEKNQEDSKKQNTIVTQLQNDQRASESLTEKEKLLGERDLAQRRVVYFSMAGNNAKALEFQREVRRLDECLNPSKAPSIQSDRPQRRHIWPFFRH
jgi:hypothetical protein